MEPVPPCPDVRFPPDFLRRLEGLVLRLSAARERREGSGRARFVGQGEEFAGYRPYRPGEDLRQLDWTLLARLDRPFVRVMRREASERWTVLVDASASMAVGPPGKLQRAAELACAVCALGLKVGATVRVAVSPAEAGLPPRTVLVRRQSDLLALLAFFEALRAGGRAGLAALLTSGASAGDAGRVILIGDLCDLKPADVEHLVRPGRDLTVLELLAPYELVPAEVPERVVQWTDPETGEDLAVTLDRAARAGYERALEAHLEDWRTICARHGIAFGCWSTDLTFEEVLRAAAIG